MDLYSETQCIDENRRDRKTAESNTKYENILVGADILQKLSAAKHHRLEGGRNERMGKKKS